MGRVCRVCGRQRANERFGGKGYRAYVCDKCRKKPKVEQQRVLLGDEVFGFLAQSNISAKNIERLKVIERFEIEEVARQAAVLREIALVMPRKKKRWPFLRAKHPEIFQRAIDVGFISPCEDWEESLGACPFDASEYYLDAPFLDRSEQSLDDSSFGELDEVNKLLLSIDDEKSF